MTSLAWGFIAGCLVVDVLGGIVMLGHPASSFWTQGRNPAFFAVDVILALLMLLALWALRPWQ